MSRAERQRGGWIGVLVGLAALLAVVGLVAARGEEARFLEVVRDAEPAWLLLAVVLQVSTYAMEAGAWRLVLAKAGTPVPFGRLYALALVALFTNQALPVAGLAGTFVVVDALARRGVSPPVAMAAVMVDEVGFVGAYALAIGAGVLVLRALHDLPAAVLAASAAALAFVAAIGAGVAWLTAPGRALPPFVARRKRLADALRPLLEADARLVRDPSLLLGALGLRCGNFVLDALTLWACLRAVGQDVAIGPAFAAFVIASLGRTLGLVPGGLGTFEGSAIGGLALVGVPVEPGLAATLVFRGLSFWIPMLPGLWLGQRVRRAVGPSGGPADLRGTPT